MLLGLILAHSLPLMLVLVNVRQGGIELKRGDWWYGFVVCMGYMGASYWFWAQNGQSSYPFIDWGGKRGLTILEALACWLIG